MYKRLTAFLIATAAMLVFGATLAHALLYVNPDEIVATADTPAAHIKAPAEYPVRLLVPSLSIDANVQYVGITKKGTMSVPNNFTDVGWYREGTIPGQPGSAVFAGHVDNALALPGVFKHLQDISIGADIYVQSKGGTQLRFKVDDVETYNVSDVPTSRIFSKGGAESLVLITCEGDWVQSAHSYDHRLVVYAHLVSVVPGQGTSEKSTGSPAKPNTPPALTTSSTETASSTQEIPLETASATQQTQQQMEPQTEPQVDSQIEPSTSLPVEFDVLPNEPQME